MNLASGGAAAGPAGPHCQGAGSSRISVMDRPAAPGNGRDRPVGRKPCRS